MIELNSPEDVHEIAKNGYYIALRVGFAFPLEEVNALPAPWVDHYTTHRFMLHDPVIRWIYANTGAITWGKIDLPDPMRVMRFQSWKNCCRLVFQLRLKQANQIQNNLQRSWKRRSPLNETNVS